MSKPWRRAWTHFDFPNVPSIRGAFWIRKLTFRASVVSVPWTYRSQFSITFVHDQDSFYGLWVYLLDNFQPLNSGAWRQNFDLLPRAIHFLTDDDNLLVSEYRIGLDWWQCTTSPLCILQVHSYPSLRGFAKVSLRSVPIWEGNRFVPFFPIVWNGSLVFDFPSICNNCQGFHILFEVNFLPLLFSLLLDFCWIYAGAFIDWSVDLNFFFIPVIDWILVGFEFGSNSWGICLILPLVWVDFFLGWGRFFRFNPCTFLLHILFFHRNP